MKDKKSVTNKIGDFLAGKGFYVVLFVCTAVIGVSAWILLSTGSGVETSETDSLAGAADGQEVMVSAGGNIADAYASDAAVSDAVESKSEVSPVPPSPVKASPTPAPTAQTKPDNQASAVDKEDAEAAMAKELVFVWPLMGDIEVIYAVDELIYNKTMADWRIHAGIDIAGELGAKIMAAADGTVVEVRNDDLLGTLVVIDHGNGLSSIYSNLTATPVVKVGDKVAMGAVIGGVGNTAIGEANEVTHLHFAMTKDGNPVNPNDYLPKR